MNRPAPRSRRASCHCYSVPTCSVSSRRWKSDLSRLGGVDRVPRQDRYCTVAADGLHSLTRLQCTHIIWCDSGLFNKGAQLLAVAHPDVWTRSGRAPDGWVSLIPRAFVCAILQCMRIMISKRAVHKARVPFPTHLDTRLPSPGGTVIRRGCPGLDYVGGARRTHRPHALRSPQVDCYHWALHLRAQPARPAVEPGSNSVQPAGQGGGSPLEL